MNIKHLAISWTTSRGRDTYGYNICRLDDRATGSRFKTCGGGYDMIGTVFGDWLAANYQVELKAIEHRAHSHSPAALPNQAWVKPEPKWALYGMMAHHSGVSNVSRLGSIQRVSLNGACGIESMIRIAEAIGLEVQREGNKKGHTVGFYVVKAVTA